MKKAKQSILLLVVFFTCFNYVFSQERREIDNTVTKRTSDIFSFSNQTSKFLIQQQLNLSSTSSTNSRQNNSTFVQQIGVNNQLVSTSNASNSNFEFGQNGNDNSINSFNNANNVDETVAQIGNNNSFVSENLIQNSSTRVLQNGNNNRFVNFSFGNVNEATLNIVQDGDNLTFEKFGTNALTNRLQFVQQGNAKTITVRSFN